MALKSSLDREQQQDDIEDQLEKLDRLIDRCKVMYEQYFMGIQKIPPAQLHRDAERRIRELTQNRIRNTGLRFRLTTLTQKFGSYNTYWRRTMRQIESGRYVRDVNRAVRRANRMGREVPDEILNALPKLHRERIRRERAKARERAEREARSTAPSPELDELSLDELGLDELELDELELDELGLKLLDDDEPTPVPQPVTRPAAVREQRPHAHRIDETLLGDFDMDSMFASITKEAEAAVKKHQPAAGRPTPKSPAATPAKPRAAAPARPRAAVPPRPRRPTPTRAPSRTAAPPPGMTEKQTRDLYTRYKQARELVGESTKGLTYDKLVSTLNKQAPRIMEKHGASGVQFSVVLKGDRAILKARPKKK